MKKLNRLSFLLFIVAASCSNDKDLPDAYGNFQTKEIMVSTEVGGKLLKKEFEEGSTLTTTKEVALIDTIQLSLQMQELIATKKAVEAKKMNIKAQMQVLKTQKEIAKIEQERFNKMYSDGAATKKQLDDIDGNIDVIEKQIISIQSNNQSIDAELASFQAKEEKLQDLIRRSNIYPPVNGVVLQSYVEEGELVGPGKPLFKMANMNTMELRAYISGSQLSGIKIGQVVKVKIDADKNSLLDFPGKISWISSQAEFTPKNIQTREERVSQVYAIKIVVENDGRLKINMPAEVFFN